MYRVVETLIVDEMFYIILDDEGKVVLSCDYDGLKSLCDGISLALEGGLFYGE